MAFNSTELRAPTYVPDRYVLHQRVTEGFSRDSALVRSKSP